jgi:hypothetical protein
MRSHSDFKNACGTDADSGKISIRAPLEEG